MITRSLKNMQLFIAIILVFSLININRSDATPLDDYVNKPDPNYKFTVLDWSYKGDGFTMYCINMTSQKWLTENDTNNPFWYHSIVVAVPDTFIIKDTALLYITGSDNDPNYLPDPVNDDDNRFISLMAATTGTIAAVVRNIPNQPVVFTSDKTQQKRTEDAIIAYTWYMFITEKIDQPEWLLRLPMTKAVVRAFDTIETFSKKFSANVEKFMICGRSKRGWTTWTTAAVDKRVIAMAPIVMDLLNFVTNMKHHYRSLGGWTLEFEDYYDLNITEKLDTPQVQAMADIIDPYSYRTRYTIPKYIISTSCDEFFLPDDSYYYLNDLPSDKHLRIIPNAEHSLKNHWWSIFFGMKAFYLSVMYNYTRPELKWEKAYNETGGTITFYTDTPPLAIDAYHADTTDAIRRDFRAVQQDPNGPPGQAIPHPIVYVKSSVKMINSNMYVADFHNPFMGWRCFYIEASFPGPMNSVFQFTTEAVIIPNTFPFDECSGEGCRGTLV